MFRVVSIIHIEARFYNKKKFLTVKNESLRVVLGHYGQNARESRAFILRIANILLNV